MRKSLLTIILLLLPLTTAISINSECPEEVNVNEEFTCELEIKDVEGVWDLKIDISSGSGSSARILEEETWKSAYYYLKEYIEEEKTYEVTLKIEEEGEYEATTKLRQGNKKEEQTFSITATTKEEKEKEKVTKEEKETTKETTTKTTKKKQEETTTPKLPVTKEETTFLTNERQETKEVIYTSKQYQILKYLPHTTIILIILLTGIHFWNKL
jgi:thiol:disulfide interchange protein